MRGFLNICLCISLEVMYQTIVVGEYTRQEFLLDLKYDLDDALKAHVP